MKIHLYAKAILFVTLIALITGCSGGNSPTSKADLLFKQRIDKINQITDMMAANEPQAKIDAESEKLEELQFQIDELEGTMTSLAFDKLIEKHNEADIEAMGRRLDMAFEKGQ